MNDLRQISKFYSRTELNLTGTIFIPQQALDESGFPCTIVSQQCNPLTALNRQINVREQGSITKRLGDIFHLKYNISGELLYSERSLHCSLFSGFFRFADPFHPMLNGHGAAVQGTVVDTPAFHTLHSIAQLLQFCLLLLILL